MHRFLLLMFFILNCCFSVGAEARKFALLIGVDKYDDSVIPNLNCCVKDMKDLNNALMKIGFEEKDIYILTSDADNFFERALKNNFDRKVNNIYKQVQEDDMVFIAFSGHGVRKGNQDYFCPQNAKSNNVEETCISITQVMANMKNCKAKLKWIVVDACRSTVANAQNAKGNIQGINVLKSQVANNFQGISVNDVPDGVLLFQSCARGHVSYEEKRKDGNGFFIKNLVESFSLSSLNDDGELMLLRVLGDTINKTQQEVNKHFDKDQIPHFKFTNENTDISLYKDENYQYAKKLVVNARAERKCNNFKSAIEKYEEAVNRFPYNVTWKQELQMTKDIYDPKPRPLVTVPDDYASISEAYAHVKDNGVITIRPGEYELQGTIVVNRPVTIQGIVGRAEDVVINCKSAHAFQITEGSPSFRNLTVRSEAEQCSGICITGGTPKISHCILTSSNWAGMCVAGKGANPRVESCFMTQGVAGLYVMDDGLGEFKSCEFSKNSNCAVIIFSGNPTFTKCKIYENNEGVDVENKFYGNFNDCEIYKNGAGVLVMMFGNPAFMKCKIYDNNIGVAVRHDGYGNFKECDIYENRDVGIYVYNSGNPTFTKCKIHNNTRSVVSSDEGRGKFNDCEIYKNLDAGIGVFKSGYPTFTQCKIYDNTAGVVVKLSGNGHFNECEIYNNKEAGILVDTSGNPAFTKCSIHDGKGYSIYVMNKGIGFFINCDICRNESPVQVLDYATPLFDGCKFHDGKTCGIDVRDNGSGKFINCEIYGNAEPGILVHASGNPTVTGCKIHDGKDGGVSVFDKGKGTFNNNTLEKNYKNGQLLNWDIRPDAGKVSGSGNTPPIPEQ